MATWLESRVIVVAFIAAASARSRSGGITRSSAATANQLGFVFQAAGTGRVALKQETLVGPCVVTRSFFSRSETSWAKSSMIPFGVTLKNPWESGRSSVPIGDGGYGWLMLNTDSPSSGAKAATNTSADTLSLFPAIEITAPA